MANEKPKVVVKTFRDLLAWQRAMDLVVAVYAATKKFPKDETFGLVLQLRRAVVSVPSNLAEGFGRRSRTDYARFIQIALASLFEVQTQLEIARRLDFLTKEEFTRLNTLSREVEYLMSRLRQKMLASSAKIS